MKIILVSLLFACGLAYADYDEIDRLKTKGVMAYCSVVADFWDDGAWARSMGVAMVVLPAPTGYVRPDDQAKMPRDGVRHASWFRMTEREKNFYLSAFEAGWKFADVFIAEAKPDVLTDTPTDFTGVIPYATRMNLTHDRFLECLHHWPPLEV